jgi:hypothetical protein
MMSLSPPERLLIMAAACHEATFAFHRTSWMAAVEWKRSVLFHTIQFWETLPALKITSIEYMAECSHVVWMKKMLALGWLPGLQENDSEKTHPNMVSYSQLPDEAKEEDRQIVRAYLTLRTVLGEPING